MNINLSSTQFIYTPGNSTYSANDSVLQLNKQKVQANRYAAIDDFCIVDETKRVTIQFKFWNEDTDAKNNIKAWWYKGYMFGHEFFVKIVND